MSYHDHHHGSGDEGRGDQAAGPLKVTSRFSRYPLISRLIRFFTWWLVFAGIYGSSSVCPFCGQVGCPVGAASAGVVGAFFAVLVQYGAGFFRSVRRGLKAARSWFTAVPTKP